MHSKLLGQAESMQIGRVLQLMKSGAGVGGRDGIWTIIKRAALSLDVASGMQ